MSRSVLRTRARRLAVTSALLPVVALGALSVAPVASAAQTTTAPAASPAAPAAASTSQAMAATSAASSQSAPAAPTSAPGRSAELTRAAPTTQQTSSSGAEAAATNVAPATQAATAAPGAGAGAKRSTAAKGSQAPAKHPNAHAGEKVFGMPAPARPEGATDDNAMLAWAIKNSAPQERRAMADEMGVNYPAAVSVLGTVCDKGQGYAGVWAVNFSTTEVRWNVTLDGAGYAGARVLPLSHGYGAIGVPDGRHTLAFVDPATGAQGARAVTSLKCAAPQGAPVLPRPADSVTGPAPARPATAHRSQPNRTATAPQARTAPAATAPRAASASTPSVEVGPRVQTDRVAVVSPERGSALANVAVTLALGLCAVGAMIARRRRV